MKSRKFWTLNWTIDAAYVSSFTWSGGLAMKVLRMKPLGYPLTNLHMLPTSSPTSMSNIHPNLVPFPFSKVFHLYFIFHHLRIIPVPFLRSYSNSRPFSFSKFSLPLTFPSLLSCIFSVSSSPFRFFTPKQSPNNKIKNQNFRNSP